MIGTMKGTTDNFISKAPSALNNSSTVAVLSCVPMLLYLMTALLFGAATAICFSVRRKRRIWKIIGAVGAALLCLAGGALSIVLLFAIAMCGHYDFPPVMSPDGNKIASITEADCGATDSFHTQVLLKHSGYLFGIRSGATVFTSGDDPRLLDIEWVGPHELFVRYPNESPNPEVFVPRSMGGRPRSLASHIQQCS